MDFPDFETLRLQDGDVVLIQTPRGATGRQEVVHISQDLIKWEKKRGNRVMVMLLPEGWRVNRLDEEEMLRHGWLRVPIDD